MGDALRYIHNKCFHFEQKYETTAIGFKDRRIEDIDKTEEIKRNIEQNIEYRIQKRIKVQQEY